MSDPAFSLASSQEDKCQVCHQKAKKYKCPACQILYCSLDCFKLHKTELCQARQEQQGFTEDRQPTIAEASNTLDEQTLLIDEISEKNILDQSTLEKIGESPLVLELLGNRHLRDYLTLLNGKDYPKGLLKNAMQEPLFLEFANACLKAIHPDQNTPQITDEEIVHRIQESMEQ